MAAASILLMGMLDPLAMMAGMQSVMRDKSTETNQQDMEVQNVRGEAADTARAASIQEALQRAQDAISGMPDWLQKVIGGVLAAVGAIASVITGGASIALTVIGAVLLLGGEVLSYIAENVPMSDDAREALTWVAVGLKVVGSIVMSAGAGAGSAASEIGQQVAKWATQIVSHISMTVTTVNAGININNAVVANDVSDFRLDAEGFALESEEATEGVEEAASRLQVAVKGFGRAMGRIQAMRSLQDETNRAVHLA